MKKEFVISVELDGLDNTLEEIRAKHIDIREIIEDELQEHIRNMIQAYGEVIR